MDILKREREISELKDRIAALEHESRSLTNKIKSFEEYQNEWEVWKKKEKSYFQKRGKKDGIERLKVVIKRPVRIRTSDDTAISAIAVGTVLNLSHEIAVELINAKQAQSYLGKKKHCDYENTPIENMNDHKRNSPYYCSPEERKAFIQKGKQEVVNISERINKLKERLIRLQTPEPKGKKKKFEYEKVKERVKRLTNKGFSQEAAFHEVAGEMKKQYENVQRLWYYQPKKGKE